jgi:hypothetical protein
VRVGQDTPGDKLRAGVLSQIFKFDWSYEILNRYRSNGVLPGVTILPGRQGYRGKLNFPYK